MATTVSTGSSSSVAANLSAPADAVTEIDSEDSSFDDEDIETTEERDTATSERVFSLLKASFGPQQDCSLQDYIESSLMLQFNQR